eukprot:5803164-Pleurochrysis_carterae.AAC.1
MLQQKQERPRSRAHNRARAARPTRIAQGPRNARICRMARARALVFAAARGSFYAASISHCYFWLL